MDYVNLSKYNNLRNDLINIKDKLNNLNFSYDKLNSALSSFMIDGDILYKDSLKNIYDKSNSVLDEVSNKLMVIIDSKV